MTDQEKREKVIKGLENSINDSMDTASYPYFEESRIDMGLMREVPVAMLLDALALLKAQEPVKPSFRKYTIFCGYCGDRFPKDTTHYCTNCGRAVKWG